MYNVLLRSWGLGICPAHEPSDWIGIISPVLCSYRILCLIPAEFLNRVIGSEFLELLLALERAGDEERQGLMRGLNLGGEQEMGGIS